MLPRHQDVVDELLDVPVVELDHLVLHCAVAAGVGVGPLPLVLARLLVEAEVPEKLEQILLGGLAPGHEDHAEQDEGEAELGVLLIS